MRRGVVEVTSIGRNPDEYSLAKRSISMNQIPNTLPE
jgi:hypothetical protein